MTDLRTPGVYVRFDESRQQQLNAIPSAVPAFIGFTEHVEIDKENAYSIFRFPVKKKNKEGNDVDATQEIVTHKVKSLRDFTSIYGNQQDFSFYKVFFDKEDKKKIDHVELTDRYYLYDSVKLFYENGGGECFIVSIGHTPFIKVPEEVVENEAPIEWPQVKTDRFLNGLRVAADIPEVTLLLMPDLQVLSDERDLDLPVIYDAALKQCFALKDRMVIFDVPMKLIDQGGGIIDPESKLYEVDINPFRASLLANRAGFLESNPLMYGAAYYPWLYTNFFYEIDLGKIDLEDLQDEEADRSSTQSKVSNRGLSEKPKRRPLGRKRNLQNELDSLQKVMSIAKSNAYSKKAHKLMGQLAKNVQTCRKMISKGTTSQNSLGTHGRAVVVNQRGIGSNRPIAEDTQALSKEIKKLKFDIAEVAKEVEVIGDLQAAILMAFRRVPPSGAIAGLIAKTDREEGVWKAPANELLEGILGPVLRIDSGLQQDMNVHGTGLSVNAIRSSIGRGTIVWGARTLDSNNADWRYIPVRRLFIYVEQSVKQRMRDFVFEDNDRDTWIQIKLLIENFLISIWRNGGLNGQTPAEAFFVKVGLGETMTPDDILQGRMIIEIGLAAVRPLEFIKLVFTAKLEEGII